MKIKLSHPFAKIPTQGTKDAVGFDLYSTEEVILLPGESALLSCGFSIELPIGIGMMVLPRSGLALKNKVTVLNSPGLIDPDYRGQVGVILMNFGKEEFHVTVGMRIAQAVFVPLGLPTNGFEVVSELSETERGSKGYGSTGLK